MSTATGFSADFLGCMKTCILAVMWRKKDIYHFFARHGCAKIDLAAIDTDGISRSGMVDTMFVRLESKPDAGLQQLRAMLQSLLEWSHFDPYWFDTKQKLDRKTAQKSLDHLRQLQEIRDARIKEVRRRRESAEAAAQAAKSTLQQVRDEFLALHAGMRKPQERGYAFEHILRELAKLSKLEVTEPFVVVGEQIDGAVKYDGEHYVIEAKWQEISAANEGVFQFAMKVEGKMYGRGLFFSISGFTKNVVQSIVLGKALRTIFIDGEDLMLVIEGYLTLAQMIDRKVKAAQTGGLIYIHPLTGRQKQGR